MKKTILKALGLTALLTSAHYSQAQNDAARLLRSGKDEAAKLLTGYFNPLTKGLASGVNDAWYSTAKPLGPLGFDLRTGVGFSITNSDAESFTLASVSANRDYSKGIVIDPANGIYDTKIPTVVGSGKSVDLIVKTNNPILPGQTINIDTIKGIEGLNTPISLGASPFVQLSVGIVKETEIMVRFLPIQSGDYSSSGYGFGIKHSLSQWIWGVDKLPIDISGIFTYTNNVLEYKFGDNYLKSDGSSGSLSESEYKNSQKVRITTSGWQVGAIISKKLMFFTPYASIVFNNANSEMAMLGIYPVQSVRQNGATIENYTENVTDPVKLSSTLSAMRSAFGFRTKFGPIALGAEYNLSYSKDQFSTFNFNLAVNIQQLVPIPKL